MSEENRGSEQENEQAVQDVEKVEGAVPNGEAAAAEELEEVKPATSEYRWQPLVSAGHWV